jgi:hypothetical protein
MAGRQGGLAQRQRLAIKGLGLGVEAGREECCRFAVKIFRQFQLCGYIDIFRLGCGGYGCRRWRHWAGYACPIPLLGTGGQGEQQGEAGAG